MAEGKHVTPSGLVARTVYLYQSQWDKLDELSKDPYQHPATNQFRYDIKKGSTSAVLRALVDWDAPAVVKELQQRRAQADADARQAQAKTQNLTATFLTIAAMLDGHDRQAMDAAIEQVRQQRRGA